MRRSHSRRVLAAVAALVLVPAGCADRGTPESQVRDVIARAESAAEERNVSDVMALVADSYADGRGQDKGAIRDLMRAFFVINQSVHLLTRVGDIRFPSGEVALAQVDVGMLGRQSQEDWPFAVDVYEFDIRLRRIDDEWKLQSASWRRPER